MSTKNLKSKQGSRTKSTNPIRTVQDEVGTNPGVNPNMKAIHRHFELTELKNKPGKTYFADPDPNAQPIYSDGFVMQDEKEVIGDFLIRSDFPYEVATPYVKQVVTTMTYGNSYPHVILETANQILFVSYITAIANVLNSSTSDVYGIYKSFKGFTDAENLKLPKFLNSYLNIIGNIDSKLGKLEMRYAEVYLESWATLAHEYYNQNRGDNLPDFQPDFYGHKINFPVHHSIRGIEYVIQKFCSYYNSKRREFGVNVNGRDIIVLAPSIHDANFDAYVVQDEYQFDVDREDIQRLKRTIDDWVQNSTEADIIIGDDHIHLSGDFNIYNTVQLLNADVRAMKRKPNYIADYFKVEDRIITRAGSAAQLISRGDDAQTVSCPVPIDDGSVWVGYIASPCEDYNIDPRYRARFLKERSLVEDHAVELDSAASQPTRITGVN
jgi:hypothetical protein